MKDRFGKQLVSNPLLTDTVEFFSILDTISNQIRPGNNGYSNSVIGLSSSNKYTDRLDMIIENHFKPLRDFCKLGINFKETDKEYIYTADLVGLDKDKLSFRVEGLKATLSYDNPEDKRRQKFEYSFTLPEIADTETVYTSYENGELKIVIEKLKRKIKEYSF